MCIKMNGFNKNEEEINDKIKRIATEAGWDVSIEEETEVFVCYDFGKYSPAGQDFHVSANLENMDIKTLMSDLYGRYADFDCSEETYLWLDNTGHGTNGAPYDMKDLYEDMEACQEMIMDLYHAFSDAEEDFMED